jgi:hypothetical protein
MHLEYLQLYRRRPGLAPCQRPRCSKRSTGTHWQSSSWCVSVSPILAAGMLTYRGGTTGERSDWHGEFVDADNVCLARTRDVCVGRVFFLYVCFRVGCARTKRSEAVKRTGRKNGLWAGASPIRKDDMTLRMTRICIHS